MSKARLVVTAVIVEKRRVSEVARAYGVARSWIYTLLARSHGFGGGGIAFVVASRPTVRHGYLRWAAATGADLEGRLDGEWRGDFDAVTCGL